MADVKISAQTDGGLVQFGDLVPISRAGVKFKAGLGALAGKDSIVVNEISNLAAGMSTFLTAPTSLNLLNAVTNETGTGSLVFALNPTLGNITLAPAAIATGVQTLLTLTAPADTNRTLSTEVTDVHFNLARSVQWATGAVTLQRFVRIGQPTITAVGASTFSFAATVQIDGAPVAGTNATLTETCALRILTNNAAGKGIVIRTAAAQSGSALEFQNSAGTVVGRYRTELQQLDFGTGAAGAYISGLGDAGCYLGRLAVGGSSLYAGYTASGWQVNLPAAGCLGWAANATDAGLTADGNISLGRGGTGILDIFNRATLSSSVTLQGRARVGTDLTGINLTIAGGAGTGNAAGGSLIFQTAPAGLTGTVVGTQTTRLTLDSTGLITLADTVNFAFNGTTGTKHGTATTQKQSWWNATPVVQPTAVVDASGGAVVDAEARTALNNTLARLRTIGLFAT